MLIIFKQVLKNPVINWELLWAAAGPQKHRGVTSDSQKATLGRQNQLNTLNALSRHQCTRWFLPISGVNDFPDPSWPISLSYQLTWILVLNSISKDVQLLQIHAGRRQPAYFEFQIDKRRITERIIKQEGEEMRK